MWYHCFPRRCLCDYCEINVRWHWYGWKSIERLLWNDWLRLMIVYFLAYCPFFEYEMTLRWLEDILKLTVRWLRDDWLIKDLLKIQDCSIGYFGIGRRAKWDWLRYWETEWFSRLKIPFGAKRWHPSKEYLSNFLIFNNLQFT